MRFTFAILLCAITQTFVSALPISAVQSEIDARDEFDIAPLRREVYDDAQIYKRGKAKPYQVALHRTNIGDTSEHWALHIHPTAPPTGAQNSQWHVVHAVSWKENPKNGVLYTQAKNADNYAHGLPPKATSQHHVIGEFNTHGDAKTAISAIKGIDLTQKFPDENCVDWTKKAGDHMVSKGHMTSHSNGVAEFNKIYDDNKDAVRKKTGNDAANREAAGL